jgi:hypothetical protein
VEVTTEVVMRAAPRLFDWIGSAALVLALLLASPGVRIAWAGDAASGSETDFSWDPALESAAPAPAPTEAPTCAAQAPAAVIPSARQIRGLQGIPLRFPDADADGEEALNSLNNRGYNIGHTDPTLDLQKLMAEVRRRDR